MWFFLVFLVGNMVAGLIASLSLCFVMGGDPSYLVVPLAAAAVAALAALATVRVWRRFRCVGRNLEGKALLIATLVMLGIAAALWTYLVTAVLSGSVRL